MKNLTLCAITLLLGINGHIHGVSYKTAIALYAIIHNTVTGLIRDTVCTADDPLHFPKKSDLIVCLKKDKRLAQPWYQDNGIFKKTAQQVALQQLLPPQLLQRTQNIVIDTLAKQNSTFLQQDKAITDSRVSQHAEPLYTAAVECQENMVFPKRCTLTQCLQKNKHISSPWFHGKNGIIDSMAFVLTEESLQALPCQVMHEAKKIVFEKVLAKNSYRTIGSNAISNWSALTDGPTNALYAAAQECQYRKKSAFVKTTSGLRRDKSRG